MPSHYVTPTERLMAMLRIFRRLLYESRGNIIIEAAIIFPFIFFVLFSLMFLSMFFYQRLALTEATIHTARQRAATWDNSFKNVTDGSLKNINNNQLTIFPNAENDGLYWRIGDLINDGLVKKKLETASLYANHQLKSGVFKIDNPLSEDELKVDYKSYLITKNVDVEMNQNIYMPFNLSSIVGQTITARAVSDANEPDEFIRNVDMAENIVNDEIDNLLEDISITGIIKKFFGEKK